MACALNPVGPPTRQQLEEAGCVVSLRIAAASLGMTLKAARLRADRGTLPIPVIQAGPGAQRMVPTACLLALLDEGARTDVER